MGWVKYEYLRRSMRCKNEILICYELPIWKFRCVKKAQEEKKTAQTVKTTPHNN